jgi:hypothetical protein
MFCLDKDWLNVLSTQLTSVTLSGSRWLFLTMLLYFSFLKANLNGSKQLMFRSYNAWNVWVGKVTISKPNCYACFIASGRTCEPCPSRISKWWLDWHMPLRIDLIKNQRNSLNRKQIIHVFFYITIHVPSL